MRRSVGRNVGNVGNVEIRIIHTQHFELARNCYNLFLPTESFIIIILFMTYLSRNVFPEASHNY